MIWRWLLALSLSLWLLGVGFADDPDDRFLYPPALGSPDAPVSWCSGTPVTVYWTTTSNTIGLIIHTTERWPDGTGKSTEETLLSKDTLYPLILLYFNSTSQLTALLETFCSNVCCSNVC